VTNQLFGLKLASVSQVDGVYEISCQSVCNFMRRRFFEDLASFSKKQNGGKSHVTVKVFIDEFECRLATDAT